jgi:PAT family beta-lactamase induction signal transducer AmpG
MSSAETSARELRDTDQPGGIRPYIEPAPLASFFLGISSGFPLTLLLATMTYWLSKEGIDKKTIGFAVGLTTPYTLKFLWSPLLDQIRIPVLVRLFGQRRSWLFVVQALLFVAIWNLGGSDPKNHLGVFAFWAVATAFLSATQDIVIDAYRIEILTDRQLPFGTAMSQFGYRTGNLAAGAGTIALFAPEHFALGWPLAYGLTGLLILPATLAALAIGPGLHRPIAGGHGFREFLRVAVAAPFVDFFRRRGAWLILLFVLLYKLGDAMGQLMLSPMIVDQGFTNTDYIEINKLVGFWALIAGSAVGAMVTVRFGIARTLFIVGLIMAGVNLMFAGVAMTGHSRALLAAAVGLENFFAAVGLTVFATYLAGLSNLAFTATQYALLSSVAAVGRTFAAAPSGYIQEWLGWPGFYAFAACMAAPGLVCLWLMQRHGFVVQSVRQQGVAHVDTPPDGSAERQDGS